MLCTNPRAFFGVSGLLLLLLLLTYGQLPAWVCLTACVPETALLGPHWLWVCAV